MKYKEFKDKIYKKICKTILSDKCIAIMVSSFIVVCMIGIIVGGIALYIGLGVIWDAISKMIGG